MENGFRDSLPTNHDRDYNQYVNGNAVLAPQPASDRQNGLVAGSDAWAGNGTGAMANGNGNGDDANQPQRSGSSASRMNDLPDEIQHITQGFVPLGLLLSRLAQKTHNQLVDEIMALAKMPAPTPALNGNSGHAGTAIDDTSAENLNKKARLLNFVQEKHAEWVKAASVSKLIDLMNHINMQRKLDLTFARVPNPDLQTALHVLSTGAAPWMPDFSYIEPPPLSPKEQRQWIENLNTLLSIRLNLEDHANIPYHFRDYSIDSGRVTFTVPGEFEVDLTIADEDFDKQFWFIDFRFAFTPAPSDLSDSLRMFLEAKVNEALEKDGLHGCYTFLHEFVLTHKVTEYVRQAFELAKGRWVETLKVERLNRAMSIQYWSWVILGVHSGKTANISFDAPSASHLTLRWFRDGKEVKDVEILFDDADISTEGLLNRVIGRHVEYMLGSIHAKLKSNERFVKREAGLALDVWKDSPIQSTLKMQLGHAHYVTPQSPVTFRGEQRLNWQSKDPIQDGVTCLEGIRCHYIVDEINRRGMSAGCVREILSARKMGQLMWFKRQGWTDQWYLMVTLSVSGDKWWLIEVDNHPNQETRISSFTKLPLSSCAPNLEDKFFSNLTIFTAAMISHITDMRSLHQRQIRHKAHDGINYSLPPTMKIPSIYIRLSDMLRHPQSRKSGKRVAPWALDFVEIMFKGIRSPSPKLTASNRNEPAGNAAVTPQKPPLHVFLDARLKVSNRSRFGLLRGHVERDVAFKADVGSPILDTLTQRLQAIDKLADCIDAIRRSDRDIRCEEITLTKVVVTYTDQTKPTDGVTMQSHGDRWKATLQLGADGIELFFDRGNPQLRVLDLFQHLVNSDLRCRKLPFFLSSTLSIQRALEAIEDAWETLAMNDQGRVEIFAAHLDWFNIHYSLPGPGKNPHAVRRLTMQIRLRARDEAVEWHVFREEPGGVQPEDEFTHALDKVWNAEDKPDHRVGELMRAVDEAVRRLVHQSPTILKQNPPRSQSQTKSQAQTGYHKNMAAGKARPQTQLAVFSGTSKVVNTSPIAAEDDDGGPSDVVIRKEAAVALLHDHIFFLHCDPHYVSHRALLPAAAEESGTTGEGEGAAAHQLPADVEPVGSPSVKLYEVVDHVPNPVWSSSVVSKEEFVDLADGLWVRIRSPMAITMETRWTIREGKGEGGGGLELVEDVEITCTKLLLGIVKSQVENNWKGIHKRIVDRLVEDAKKAKTTE
ncbi:MED14-domain-containing protein [Durotheca rogersii]|uniref:MED14-domain-containing protein n=1 Tax=Durotheca rogersii TaxID=419775 RepID=UPI00221F2874|nr:MED14-domain-containing protein [Durotheca rogersii]KAI5867060.1 MED14-domain-containing protein [Durotheca rogersii]